MSADGSLVAVGGYSNKVRAWRMGTYGPVSASPRSWDATGTVRALAFSPDRRTLAVGADREVEFARLHGNTAVRGFASFTAPVTALAYNDANRTLAVGTEDGTVELWDLHIQRRTLALATHQGAVRALHFAPNGERVAVVGASGAARWWTLNARRVHRQACRVAAAPGSREWQRMVPDVDRSAVLSTAAKSCRAHTPGGP